jgi:hypothetical protein
MKLSTKIAVIATGIAGLGSSAAFADDSQLQNRLAREHAERVKQSPTIAIFVRGEGVGQRSVTRVERSNARSDMRTDAHSQHLGPYTNQAK